MSIRSTSTKPPKVLGQFLEEALQTTPRGILYTYPGLYTLTGTLPSTVRAAPLPTLVNPHQLILNTPKHNRADFNRYLFAHELEPRRFDLLLSPYGLSGRNLASGQSNFWLYSVRRANWYELQQRALRSYLWICRIPGVKKVYLLGSTAMGAAVSNSDVDLVIETYPHWVWPARLWLKLLLKLRFQDVFRTSFQLRKLIGTLEKQELARYKNRGGYKIDVGLLTEDWAAFRKKWVDPAGVHTYYLESAVELGSPSGLRGYTPQTPVVRWFWWLIRKFLLGLSLPLWPLIWIWAWVYIYTHRRADKFVVWWDTVCFYPLRPVVHGVVLSE